MTNELLSDNTKKQFNCRNIAIAIHCNSKTPVVLGFNYEGHNAPAYQFNNSAGILRQSVGIYQHFGTYFHCYFRSRLKFRHYIQRPRYSKIEQWFGDQTTCFCVFSSPYRSTICHIAISHFLDLIIEWLKVTCFAPRLDNFYHVWSRSTHQFLTYNVFTANTVRHAVTLWPWLLTSWPWTFIMYRLITCSNLSEMEHSLCPRRAPSNIFWIWQEVASGDP